MKKKYTALLLACTLMFAIGGCTISQGEYYSETAHTGTVDDSTRFGGVAGVSNYYSLQSAVFGMIGAHRENNIVPITDYDGSLEEDLKTVTQEITTENPLGCFAVASLAFDQTRVLAYRELSITVQYKRTAQEILAVKEVPSLEDMERRLTDFLASYGTSAYYSVSGIDDDDDMLCARALKCWYTTAEKAYGIKNVTFESYPEDSSSRIIEINVEWLRTEGELREQSRIVSNKVAKICSEMSASTPLGNLELITQYLTDNVQYDDQAMRALANNTGMYARTDTFTAYGALIDGVAAQAGIIQAAKLMCDNMKIPCNMVCGTNGGVSCCWLRVQNDGAWYNYDPYGSRQLVDDGQMKAMGYSFYPEVYGNIK